jgi:hypothetical protein
MRQWKETRQLRQGSTLPAGFLSEWLRVPGLPHAVMVYRQLGMYQHA